MSESWKRILVAGLPALSVALFIGEVAQAAVAALFAAVLVGAAIDHFPSSDRTAMHPWRWIAFGGLAALGAAAVRVAHGALDGVTGAFPSPGEALSVAGHAMMIAGATGFVRARTRERTREDVVDATLVAVLTGAVIYTFVLGDYLVQASFSSLDRWASFISFLSVLVLAGVAARVSFDHGERNGSYRLLAGAVFAFLATETLVLIDIAGRAETDRLAGLTLGIAYVTAAAAATHPGAPRLTVRPGLHGTRLTQRRVALLFVALIAGPMLLALLPGDAPLLDVVITMGSTGVLSMLVLARMVLLVRSREARADREQSLRELGSSLVSSSRRSDALDAALAVASQMTASLDRSEVAFFEQRGTSFMPIATSTSTGRPPRFKTMEWTDLSASQQDSLVAGQLVVLEHVPGLPGFDSQHEYFMVVAPVASRSTDRPLLLIVVAHSVVNREVVAGMRSIADQIGLAQDSFEMTEQMHQRRSNRRFRALVENSSDVVLVVSEDSSITFVSPTVRRLLGRAENDVVGRPVLELVDRDDQMHVRRLLTAPSSTTARHASTEVRMLHGSGDLRWFELEARDLSEEAEVRGVVLTARDISDRKRTEEQLLRSEARFRLLVQNTSDVVAIVDDEQLLSYVSPSVEGLLGLKANEVLGLNVFELLSVTEAERLRSLSMPDLDGSVVEVRLQGGDGHVRAVEVAVTDMRDQPEVDGTVLNIRDVTERKSLEDDLRHQALHDDLTGLANRNLFADRVREAVTNAAGKGELVGVLFVDLDNFKLINDSLGHLVGDQVLVSCADRIQQTLRLSDAAARIGGDEFAILLTGVYGESEIMEIADRVRTEIGAPISVGDHDFRLTASIGVVVEGQGLRTGEDLIRAADLAMYQAKQDGKDRLQLFESHMEASAVQELELKTALARALENDEFVLHYQPIVDMETERIKGIEALIRWEDPNRGMVSPATFIPAAEETGLIREIGLWVARQAATDLAMLGDLGHDLYCSVNVSGRQMVEANFVDLFIDAISPVASDRIVIELTESVLAVPGTNEMFDRFHEHGCRIALDDFGTGYSALQYLQTFDIDLIKIDRSFVTALGDNKDTTMVQAVLDVAHSIDAQTVAEGIEDTTELGLLRELGVDLGQGYHFARPMPAADLVERLAADAGAVVATTESG